MSETKLEILMTEEEANKYLNSFKEKMGYKDISSIVKSTNKTNDTIIAKVLMV
ncbi:MAG TPA: hypothetical protein VLL98_03170 [Rickettsiales bacterium]|nr:hypothetical protein [Rickettsiales bacterium]